MSDKNQTDKDAKAARFGTFGGVFTPSLLTILGVIMFKAKKRTPAMLWAHRGAVIALIAAFLVHVITKI